MTWANLSLRTLPGVLWRELVAGCAQWDHPFRTPVLGTAEAGGAVRLRTVILRAVHRAQRQLVFHTDLRSPKAAALRRDARAEWLFYDATTKVQLRVRAQATLHCEDALADQAWRGTPLAGRANYLTQWPPGRKIGRWQQAWPISWKPGHATVEQSEAGRVNFGVVVTQAQEMEFLKLDVEGNRRALFTWKDGAWGGAWLVP